MAKAKKPSNFTAESVRFCAVCDSDIHIGLGGEHNWKQHLDSARHAAKAAKSGPGPAKANAKLETFFRAKTQVNVASQPQSTSSQPTARTLGDSASTKVIPLVERSVAATTPSPANTIVELRSAAAHLPPSIPEGSPTDRIACFASSPAALIPDGEQLDAWEYLDPVLNNYIGYNTSIEDVAKELRRGAMGIDGLCDWLESCIRDFRIDPVLLEGKIERVIDAIKLVASTSDNSFEVTCVEKAASPLPLAVGTSSPSHARIKSLPPSTEPLSSSFPCPGYHLELPVSDTRSPLMFYPIALETQRALPWTMSYINEQIILHSTDCAKLSFKSDVKTGGLLPCPSCRLLDTNTLVMGIRHRALDGTHEKTPWIYGSPVHWLALLTQKKKQIATLKMSALNSGRKLVVSAHHLDDWKRLVVGISQSRISRIQTALTVAFRSGTSVRGLLQMLDRAVQQLYHSKSYEEVDFQRSFLIWKLGGASAATIAHHSLGLPSLTTTRRHIMIKPILASSSFPNKEYLLENLHRCFAGYSGGSLSGVTGFSMPIDEIKIQE
ncbi:hypothetical protein EIP86_009534, partial [Pleurotus ostreatoroseus]